MVKKSTTTEKQVDTAVRKARNKSSMKTVADKTLADLAKINERAMLHHANSVKTDKVEKALPVEKEYATVTYVLLTIAILVLGMCMTVLLAGCDKDIAPKTYTTPITGTKIMIPGVHMEMKRIDNPDVPTNVTPVVPTAGT